MYNADVTARNDSCSGTFDSSSILISTTNASQSQPEHIDS
jgi:hypothetical protein